MEGVECNCNNYGCVTFEFNYNNIPIIIGFETRFLA